VTFHTISRSRKIADKPRLRDVHPGFRLYYSTGGSYAVSRYGLRDWIANGQAGLQPGT